MVAVCIIKTSIFDSVVFIVWQDVMVLDQSVFYGMAGIHDRHRDMRLDIDNMSYEVPKENNYFSTL